MIQASLNPTFNYKIFLLKKTASNLISKEHEPLLREWNDTLKRLSEPFDQHLCVELSIMLGVGYFHIIGLFKVSHPEFFAEFRQADIMLVAFFHS